MNASHEQNAELARQVEELARQRGLGVVHNVTSYSNHDGYHRYLIFDPTKATGQITIRSKATIEYTEARYSRNGQPSIKGEREALDALRESLSE